MIGFGDRYQKVVLIGDLQSSKLGQFWGVLIHGNTTNIYDHKFEYMYLPANLKEYIKKEDIYSFSKLIKTLFLQTFLLFLKVKINKTVHFSIIEQT